MEPEYVGRRIQPDADRVSPNVFNALLQVHGPVTFWNDTVSWLHNHSVYPGRSRARPAANTVNLVVSFMQP